MICDLWDGGRDDGSVKGDQEDRQVDTQEDQSQSDSSRILFDAARGFFERIRIRIRILRLDQLLVTHLCRWLCHIA